MLLPIATIESLQHGGLQLLSRLTPLSWAAVLYLGVGATALAWWFWYRGVERLDMGIVSVFFFAHPVVGGVLSGLLLHEQLLPGFWLGGVIFATGILLVSTTPHGQERH